jgi:serine protease AprX
MGQFRNTLCLTSAVALSLLAGGVVPLHASAAKPVVAVVPSGQATALSFNGSIFHHAKGEILNQRTFTFAGSPRVMISWQERMPNGLTSYWALSLDGQRIAQVQTTENTVRLRYGQFDPHKELPTIPNELRAGKDNDLFLVQFVGTPLDEMRGEIGALGGTVERFLTDNTHVVRMNPRTRDRVNSLPYVRWVGEYHPAYRLDDEIAASVVLGGVRGGDQLAERFSIEVMRRGMDQQQALADMVRAMGGIVEVFTPDQFRMEVTVTPAQVAQIARRGEVNFIDPWGGPGGTDMDLIRQTGGAVPTLSTAGFLGQGVRGEIFDTGIINNHTQWSGQVPLINGSTASDSHGMGCYGINFATGNGNVQATGMMPQREQGIFSFYNNTSQFGGGPTRLSLNTAATDPNGQFRSVFQTSSVGSNRTMVYTTISAEVDDYLWRVQYLSCQSQSNASGSRDSRPQAWSKNIVSVGGLNLNETVSFHDDVWATGASIGPAPDLRVKPDLSHSFGNIFTTYSTSPTGYGQFGGTSGATPITCGHFGLLHQMWHEGVWDGFGGASSVFLSRPASTTAKALMINTAHRYPVTQGNMTRSRVGWGLAHLGNAYNLREKTFIVNETELLTQGQTASYPINVDAGEPEFKATLVYIDPQGNPAAAQARVNDLTLKVTSPSNVVYYGNNGMIGTAISGAGQHVGANHTVPGGDANTVDTVENVFVANPEAGTWTVEVIATQIVADAVPSTAATDASFALVVTGGTQGPPPPLRMQFPGGLPFLVNPNQPHEVTVNIIEGTQVLQPGTAKLHARADATSPFIEVPLVHVSGDQYRGQMPGFSCGDTPQLYFSAQGNLGGAVTLPRNAPESFYSTTSGVIVPEPILETNFVSAWPTGWSATGLWHVTTGCTAGGTPCAAGPYAYFGRAATCNYNLPTGVPSGSLNAPQITLPAIPPGGSITVRFCYSLQTENSPNLDKAELFVNGVTRAGWRIPDAEWAEAVIDLSEFAGETVNLSWRFNALNTANNTFRGWHLNNVRVQAEVVGCPSQTCYANCDGSTTAPVLNVDDFSCFINAFAAAQALSHEQQVASYANCDGSTVAPALNVDDFSCFINAFAQGCP